MRKFSNMEKMFIMRNEDRYTLKEMARKFNCSCEEVYNEYCRILKTEEYFKYVDKRKTSHNEKDIGGEDEGYSNEEAGGDEEEFN